MVEHGALSKSHVYRMLGSKDARVRRAAFTLLEASNPTLRRNSELLIEIIRFIWDANPSYDVYREFSNRHLLVAHKVHELIGARLKIERREQQSDPIDQRTEDTRQYKSGFFKQLFRRRRIPLDQSIPVGRSSRQILRDASWALQIGVEHLRGAIP